MFSKIVVPLDGSAQSYAALPVARTFARATGGQLTLLRVCVPGEQPAGVRAQLARVAEEFANAQIEVREVVREGEPGPEILKEVQENDAELVIMRTHARSGLERLVLGSVTQHVLTHTPVPLVLVRAGHRRLNALRRVLVPLDGSPGGAVALSGAIGLARATGAGLRLLQVVVPIERYAYNSVAWDGGAAYLDPDWDTEALTAARTYVDGMRTRLATSVEDVTAEAILASDVADTVVQRAAEQECDLVMMSSHTLTGVARAILGSVADAVVRKADCPVLVIRSQDRQPAPASQPSVNPELAL